MHYKQNNKETKTYVQGLRPFGNTLPRGIKTILKKNGYNYSEIINKWSKFVGKEISSFSYTKSIKMKKGDTNGTLIIAVKRGNEINLEYSKKKIIDKINSYFGYKLIDSVRLKSFNFEDTKVTKKSTLIDSYENFEKKINQIKSKNIKNSLSQLLKAVKND